MQTRDEQAEWAEAAFPRQLGPCRLLRPLGRGSMGSVYLAELVEPRGYAAAGTRLAVKVLHPHLAGAPGSYVDRFEREARLGAAVVHPGLVRTYEVGEQAVDGASLRFLVLEYVEGRTLRAVMEGAAVLPEPLLRRIAAELADALEALHRAGAVHRDVKPANVLLTPEHRVKLMDLGVARLLSADADGGVTSVGEFVGSPVYAAPEQFEGEVGEAADLYSLGVLLYEAATGTQPFAAGGFHAIMKRHLDAVPPAASSVNPRLSRFFAELLSSLLEKLPERRFASARDLACALEEGEGGAWWRQRESVVRAREEMPSRLPVVVRETALYGREGELAQLHALLAEARSGRGRSVLIEGEAGVGKTRLIDEFLRRVKRQGGPLTELWSTNAPGSLGVGQDPMLAALREHLGEEDLESRLARCGCIAPRQLLAFAASLRGVAPPGGCEALGGDALRALVCRLSMALSRERPLVWVVEDLHYASPESRATALALARETARGALLLVVTTRPGLSAEELGQWTRNEVASCLSLGRLRVESTRQMVAAALGSSQGLEPLDEAVVGRSGGNPYFAFEILRSLRERGVLERRQDGSHVVVRPDGVREVPATLRVGLLARIGDLAAPDRAILDAGAVVGFEFEPDVVAHALGREALDLLQALAEVERRSGVVRAAGRMYRFDHHLLQEVVVGALPASLKAAYHARLAAAYEETKGLEGLLPAEVPAAAAVFLARHYLEGGAKEKGLRHVERAIGHLLSVHGHGALVELADLAVSAQGWKDPGLRFRLRQTQERSLDSLGARERQREVLDEMTRCAHATGEEHLLPSILRRRSFLAIMTSEYGTAAALSEEILSRARAAGDRESVAHGHYHLGMIYSRTGPLDVAREHCESAMLLYREHGDRRGECMTITNLGTVYKRSGEPERARQCYESALLLARELGDRRQEVTIVGNLASTLMDVGDFDVAHARLREHLAIAAEIGHRWGEAGGLANLGVLQRDLGAYREARRLLERALRLSRDISQRALEAWLLKELLTIEVDEGRLDEGVRLAEELRQRPRDGYVEACPLLELGGLAEARDDLSQARTCYREALAFFRSLASPPPLGRACLALGRLEVQGGDPALARSLLEEAEQLVHDHRCADPGPLPTAYLALLGCRDPRAVVIGERSAVRLRAEAHLVLHRAGGGDEHLTRARELLETMSAHLAPVDRDSFWQQSPLGRRFRAVAEPSAG